VELHAESTRDVARPPFRHVVAVQPGCAWRGRRGNGHHRLAELTGLATLWFASMSGIVAGMCLNYVVLDRLVFSSLARLAVHTGWDFLQSHVPARSCRRAVAELLNSPPRPA
jgi:hypothetical protein